ncbi:magnesium-translocating P-type ATPase [Izhakiella australiensis]|uniref:Magnesium-transporting ATPase, P-type 1 n=1 Tax=Izhakiella australiensis TaxID=1926881 RepID=A0A1S8YI28_9GAMM|nr:magnesium-translocating P-type ATPase [Izhakiella australiensis]OON38595.1 magnesium-translocating P-type ATPase [Izhakiella australiensis]
MKNPNKTFAQLFAVSLQAQQTQTGSFNQLRCCHKGLTRDEALNRLDEYGPNHVASEKAPHALIQLTNAFKNPFIALLTLLATISFVIDFWLPYIKGEATSLSGVIIMMTMVILSALLRFIQEYRTNKAAAALKSLVRTTTTVVRRGTPDGESAKMIIPLEEVVPGDIVWLSAGDMVPGDVRLLESRDLFVSQTTLSGEALPVEKFATPGALPNPCDEHTLPELSGFCLMGTSVASGTATGLVVATGADTWYGNLASSLLGDRPQTAFDRGVNSVSKLLIRFMLVMVPVVLFINGFTRSDWGETLMFALAVAVGLTPEMLPMIVSANLAKGAIAMARRKVVVKHLNAIQNFGAMDVLCTDKTGTLTQDNIILAHHLNIAGKADDSVLQLAWLNSHHQSGVRNLIDRAILRFSEGKAEISAMRHYRKVDELPFDFERRRLSIVVADQQQNQRLICKGAVEEMLAVASHIREGHRALPLDAATITMIQQQVQEWSKRGYRVLLIAERDLTDRPIDAPLTKEDERDLVIAGLLTFLDPPKESAASALRALREHGVAVKVLTGDSVAVSSKICRDVGLEPGEALCGSAIDHMSDHALACEVEQRNLFCRLTPQQKSRVLQALQYNQHTVGFLGDGINDAPALRCADIGISVDSATDIAKESADIILLEKSLMVLEEGVLKGRETFGNIIKYLNMTASSNFGNVFSVLVASAFLPFLPMLAIQLLIQNLLYDISQLTLPWDKMDRAFLRRPRKWDASNIRRFMLFMGPTSSIFDIATWLVLWFVFAANSPDHQALFQSGWFVEGLLSQTLVVHMLRTRRIPFIQSCAAWPVMLMTGLIMLVGITIPFLPLSHALGMTPLPLSYFPWLVTILAAYCLVAQGAKTLYIRLFGQWF